MPVGRASIIFRRLSSSDGKFKNINISSLHNKESLIVSASAPLDLSLPRRFATLGNSNYLVPKLKRSYSDNIIKMTTAGAEVSNIESESNKPKYTNCLIKEKSPYLLQHAHNPVEWYPWCQEAFDKAKKENKLIFLSIGYSTCHWCHVMERESFENEDIAKVMNENFINIKVDREERPDVDSVYMLFIMATSGGGGWPLSVFLTPDLNPITGGTYFPPNDHWDRPGFKTVLESLAAKWKNNQEQMMESGNKIVEVLRKISDSAVGSTPTFPNETTWLNCLRFYMNAYEPEFGGFGSAPKFPQPSIFNFLFHYYARDKNDLKGKKCLEMSLHTLTKMANGGIHDHISGGFSRYSVDNDWHVPHFEKMLYDQAQLIAAYTDAYLATKDDFFADVVRDIITYTKRDLHHSSGGFYSAEDADSFPYEGAKEKLEGAFYVWDYSEIKSLLEEKIVGSTTYLDIFSHYYNIEAEGNISPDSDPHGELESKNVLIVYGTKQQTCDYFNITTETFEKVISECKEILFKTKCARPRPYLDSKLICSWNGLMISGLARAGQGLSNKEYIDDAIKTAQFVREYLYNPETKRLCHSCYRGEDGTVVQAEKPIGFVDDYAYLIKGLLDLYEASFVCTWLEWACELQQMQNELFWDENGGGYFTCDPDESSVILRLKEDRDGAEPAGNSVACWNLLRLSAYSDKDNASTDNNYAELAKKILSSHAKGLNELPAGHPEMMSALMFFTDSPTQVLIAGGVSDPRTLELARAVRSRLLPGRVLALADPTADCAPPGLVLSRPRPVGDCPAAYVCRRFACSLPVTDVKQLEDLLDEPHKLAEK